MSSRTSADAALQPVRDAMLQSAAERAEQALGRARAAADATVAAARREADAAIAAARASGIAEAEPAAAAELNRSRQAARSVALHAALGAHEQVAGRIRAAVLALRGQPDYPRLRDALAARASLAAGRGAQVTEHPQGGVIARAGGTVVDCSLPRLADRAVEVLGARICRLCGS